MPIRMPALVDEIGVNVFDVLLAQNVVELSMPLGAKAPPSKMLELRRHLPQIGCNIGTECMTARALLDEFGLPGLNLGRASPVCGWLREWRVVADLRLRHFAAIKLEGDDPIHGSC